ncbi:MAG: RNA polymerase sigma factor [Gemmatimonadaceae bacterium]
MEAFISSSEEAVLVKIVRVAREYARETLPIDEAEDLAHDIALNILERLHAGHAIGDVQEAGGLLRAMVKRRAIDGLRQRQRREERDAEYARCRNEMERGLASPDAELAETELAGFRERILGELPEAVRRAYVMVREEHATYQRVADELAVSRSSVKLYVSRAQWRFRRGLAALGIPVESVARGRRRAA